MYTLESFCNFVFGYPYHTVVDNIKKEDYIEFDIPKKNGQRTISYLDKKSGLAYLQNRLLCKFLNKQLLPINVKGFRKGENYKSFLSEHIGAKYFLRIDIRSFFPSINSKSISEEITKLIICNDNEEKQEIVHLICDIVTLNDKLPQGACTSPVVSNIVMVRIDQRITKYCQIFDICYTRYADDLLFSSKTFDFSENKYFLRKLKFILNSKNLKVNYSKLKVSQDEMILNGYVISDREIRLSRKRLYDIRKVIKFSNDNHNLLKQNRKEEFILKTNNLDLKYRDLKKYPFKTLFQFVQYMCGYRSYLISFIDENNSMSSFQKQIKKLIKKLEKQIKKLA